MKWDGEFAYSSYGVNCTEVEVDVLTGEVEVIRCDILFDCGQRLGICKIHTVNIDHAYMRSYTNSPFKYLLNRTLHPICHI